MGRNQLQQKGGPHSHPGGRISSINRLFAASNGLTNLTPASSKPSWRYSVSRWRTPARLYRVPITLHRERRSVLPHRRSAHAEGGRQPSYRPASNPAHESLYGSRNRNLLILIAGTHQLKSGETAQRVSRSRFVPPKAPSAGCQWFSAPSREGARSLQRYGERPARMRFAQVSGGRYLSMCPTRKAECKNFPLVPDMGTLL